MNTDMAKKSQNRPWRKILFENQNYPDNYVDDSFLEEMKKNVDVRIYSFSCLVFESGIVSQQLSSICIFVAIFIYLDMNLVSQTSVLFFLMTFTTIGYIVTLWLKQTTQSGLYLHTGQDLKSIVLFTSFVYGLSPLLKTLTKTISTDTIYSMTVCMLSTNLLLHDYISEVATASASPSLNASIFASVCLASRLPTSWHAFVTVMLAMQMFAVLPQIRIKLKNHKRVLFIFLTVAMATVATCMIFVISWGFAAALAAAQLSIILLFPWWMVKLQRYKNNIHGPWDEATIHE